MGKIVGWFVSMSFFILGLACANRYSQLGDMTALGVSILSFGIIFWLSKTTYQTTKNVMMATTGIMVVTGLLARFVLQDYVGAYFGLNLYFSWEMALTVIGLPAMIYVFKNDKT